MKIVIWGRRPLRVLEVFFFRVVSSCILSDAFEGRLPRPGRMVDGKLS